jgi:hypothetical protein
VNGLVNVQTGFTPRYDDIVFEMIPTRINPSTNKPDYDYTNLGFLFPQNITTEIVNITVQLPHKWKEGTTIYPHVHVRQAANQQAVFKLDYLWYNAGDTIPTTWTTYTMNEYAYDLCQWQYCKHRQRGKWNQWHGERDFLDIEIKALQG